MARLRSDFWVSAYLRLCSVEGIPAALRKRGHEEAGAVFIKADHLNQTASLFGPAPQTLMQKQGSDERHFFKVLGPVFNGDVEQRIEQEIRFDRDLWVIEIDCQEDVYNFPLMKY